MKLKFSVRRHEDAYGVFATNSGREIASITMAPDGTVKWVGVDDGSRRTGLATQLYERASQVACKRMGVPLRSDSERSGYAQAFWEKQVSKGRARCAGPTKKASPRSFEEVVYGRGGCHAYALECPPPASLAGRRKS